MTMNTGDGYSAADSGRAVAGAAREQAGQVGSTAADQAGQVASVAADQARQVGRQAADRAHGLLDEARRAAWHQGEVSTGQLADAVGRLRDQAAALLDGRPDEAGPLRDHGRSVVDRLDSVTRRLESGGMSGLIDDLQGFARRRPGAFLAGAGVLGFAAGRLARAGRDAPDVGRSGPSSVDRSGTGGYNGVAGGTRPTAGQIPSRTTPATYPDDAAEPTLVMPGVAGTAGGDGFGAAPPPPPPPPPPSARYEAEPPLPPGYLER